MNAWYVKKPEILDDDFDLRRHAVIEASAGTGKTFTLEHLALEMMIHERAEADELLLVTFTEKAAAEIKGRVRKRLSLALDPDADGCSERPPDDGPYWTITPEIAGHLRHVLSEFDQCQISTIHAFCSQLLRTMPIATNAREGVKVEDSGAILEVAVLDCLRRRFTTNEEVRPTFEMALSLFDGLDGLTKFLKQTNRLSNERIEAARREAPTYADAVIREFRAIDWPLLHDAVVAHRHIRKHEESIANLARLAEQLPSERSWAVSAIIRAGFFDVITQLTTKRDGVIGKNYANGAGPINDTVDRMRAWPEGFRVPLPLLLGDLVPVLRQALRDTREERAWTDFDEMIAEVAQAIQQSAADGTASPLLRELRARFRFVLVDEFQDTSKDQWDIFHALIDVGAYPVASIEAPEEGGALEERDAPGEDDARARKPAGVPTLIVVGDPKQAIYAFRDADVYTYLDARATLIDAYGAQCKPLTRNYRSHPGLIEAYNRLFENPERPLLSSSSIAYDQAVRAGLREAESPRLLGPRFDRGERSFINVLDIAYEGRQDNAAQTRRKVIRFMAREIRQLLDGKHRLQIGETARPLRPADIMFLGERKKELVRMARELRHYGIPHAFFKQGGIYETEEAADFYHLFRSLAAPAWNAGFARVLLTPFFDLSPTDALRSVEADARAPARARLQRWATLAEEGRFAVLFYEVLYGSGLAARLPLTSDDERAWINYVHIAEELQALLVDHQLSMAELCTWIGDRIKSGSDEDLQDLDSHQRLDPGEDAVRLLTLHKAKGLEAPIVFLAGKYNVSESTSLVRDWELYRFLRDGAVEHRFGIELEGERKAAAEAAIHEERERLGYVAATRPQAALYLAQSWSAANLDDRENAVLYGGSPPRQDGAGALAHCTFLMPRDTPGFSWIPCDGQAPPRRPARPPTEFFHKLAQPDVREVARATAAREARHVPRASPIFHSYSSLKDKTEMTGYADEDRNAGLDLDELRAKSRLLLPPGATTGSSLHKMLEEVDQATLRAFESAEAFVDSPAEDAVFGQSLAQFGLDRRFHATCKAIAWWAYRRPLVRNFSGQHTLRLDAGLAATRNKPEIEFLFDRNTLAPEVRAALMGAPTSAGDGRTGQLTLTGLAPPPGRAQADRVQEPAFRIADDYLFGFIDVVFEHDGRYYVLDWKTDNIGVYNQDSMRTHVEEYYGVQARLYSLAMLQMLGVSLDDEDAYDRRFGGFAYSFLRGIHETDAVYANRYPLAELRRFIRTIDSKTAERRKYPSPQIWRQIQ